MNQTLSTESIPRPLKVLHLVSGQTEGNTTVNGTLLPLLMRGDRRSVQSCVVYFAPGHPHAAVIRQGGIPVHEIRLSRRRWSLLAPRGLLQLTRDFTPDVIHAWGHTAQLAASLLRKLAVTDARCIWNMTSTDPLSASSGSLDRAKLKLVLRLADKADQLIYPAEIARSRHRRLGFPEPTSEVIAAGVDVERYKPDFSARQRVRQQLELQPNAFVIGMQAPFQAEFDHLTFFKAAGEIIRANPHAQILLAGRGLQRGNAPLMALVGGGTLATRVRLLGEWSDSAGLFNACDVVVSSALTDELRMTLVMAMLCGVPCVATGMGAQAEVVGTFGISAEPGSEISLTRGIARVMEMPAERRAFLAKGARQHALTNFNQLRSIQRYHALYRGTKATTEAAVPPVKEPVEADPATGQLTAA